MCSIIVFPLMNNWSELMVSGLADHFTWVLKAVPLPDGPIISRRWSDDACWLCLEDHPLLPSLSRIQTIEYSVRFKSSVLFQSVWGTATVTLTYSICVYSSRPTALWSCLLFPLHIGAAVALIEIQTHRSDDDASQVLIEPKCSWSACWCDWPY